MQQPQKQLTLFQAGFKVDGGPLLPSTSSGPLMPPPRPLAGSSASTRESTTSASSVGGPAPSGLSETSDAVMLIDDDDDDLLLAQALELNIGENDTAAPPPPAGTALETLPGFDVVAGASWVYPVNYPVRQYQFSTVQTALYHNTLVSLPTGLGKTFIAAVVMYNFYRWYPMGKVVFMAPTKPLVAQQIDACYRVMGIPRSHTAEVTGQMSPGDRRAIWQQRRVFFLTAQVLVNDLTTGSCPAHSIRCVVVDEAHKALGNHAYCQVIRSLSLHTTNFRVLALSATPGSDLKAVVQVLSNLLISKVEVRSEESADIMPYTHQRQLEKIVVPLSEELKHIKDKYMQVLATFARRLIQQKVVYARDETTLTKYQLLRARDAFKASPPPGLVPRQSALIEGDFVICMSLYHALELLLQHGSRSFYTFLLSVMNGEKGSQRGRAELSRLPVFCELMTSLGEQFDSPPTDVTTSAQVVVSPSSLEACQTGLQTEGDGGLGAAAERLLAVPQVSLLRSHPKLEKLRDIVQQHFRSFAERGQNTRVMVFSQYRESVVEIAGVLQRLQPTVRAMHFIGQTTGRASRGFSQKEQLKVIAAFRTGGFNTLVSTCVGEEGLDIGDVDLIVCYDVSKSPIQMVQRMGRTGRKRQGRIVILVTEGKEEHSYNQSVYQKKSILKTIMTSSKLEPHLYKHSPRMIPKGLRPQCQKLHMLVNLEDEPPRGRGRGRGRARSLTASPSASAGGKRGRSRGARSVSSTRGLASVGGTAGSGTGRMASLLAVLAPDRGPAEEAYLTEAELEEWDRKYKMRPEDGVVRRLPDRRARREDANVSVSDTPGPDKGVISLYNWLPWQTTLQNTYQVSHSQVTRNLVTMIGFMARQAEMGAQVYDLEMEAIRRTAHGPDDTTTATKPSKLAASSTTASSTTSATKTTTAASFGKSASTAGPSPPPSPSHPADVSVMSESEQISEAIRRSLLECEDPEPSLFDLMEHERTWEAVRSPPSPFPGWGDMGDLAEALTEVLRTPLVTSPKRKTMLEMDVKGDDGHQNLTDVMEAGGRNRAQDGDECSVEFDVGAAGEDGGMDGWSDGDDPLPGAEWMEDNPPTEVTYPLAEAYGKHVEQTPGATDHVIHAQNSVRRPSLKATLDDGFVSNIPDNQLLPAEVASKHAFAAGSEDDGSPILPSQNPNKRRKLSRKRVTRLFPPEASSTSPALGNDPSKASVQTETGVTTSEPHSDVKNHVEHRATAPGCVVPAILVRRLSSQDLFDDDDAFVAVEEPAESMGFSVGTNNAPCIEQSNQQQALETEEETQFDVPVQKVPPKQPSSVDIVDDDVFPEKVAKQQQAAATNKSRTTIDKSSSRRRGSSGQPLFDFGLEDDDLFAEIKTPSEEDELRQSTGNASPCAPLEDTVPAPLTTAPMLLPHNNSHRSTLPGNRSNNPDNEVELVAEAPLGLLACARLVKDNGQSSLRMSATPRPATPSRQVNITQPHPSATSLLGITQLLDLVDVSSTASPLTRCASSRIGACSSAHAQGERSEKIQALEGDVPSRMCVQESSQDGGEKKPVFDLFASFFDDSLVLGEINEDPAKEEKAGIEKDMKYNKGIITEGEHLFNSSNVVNATHTEARKSSIAFPTDIKDASRPSEVPSVQEPDVSPILSTQARRSIRESRDHSTPLARRIRNKVRNKTAEQLKHSTPLPRSLLNRSRLSRHAPSPLAENVTPSKGGRSHLVEPNSDGEFQTPRTPTGKREKRTSPDDRSVATSAEKSPRYKVSFVDSPIVVSSDGDSPIERPTRHPHLVTTPEPESCVLIPDPHTPARTSDPGDTSGVSRGSLVAPGSDSPVGRPSLGGRRRRFARLPDSDESGPPNHQTIHNPHSQHTSEHIDLSHPHWDTSHLTSHSERHSTEEFEIPLGGKRSDGSESSDFSRGISRGRGGIRLQEGTGGGGGLSEGDSPLPPPPVRRVKKRLRNSFLEEEAQLSDAASSDDDEDAGEDEEDCASLIDDAPDPTQADVDMRAVYMRSVRSPAGRGRFKIGPARHRVPDCELFSQVVQQDDDYQQDSFCVGSDPEHSATDYSSGAESADQRDRSPSKPAAGRRRRVIRLSSSEDDGGDTTRRDASAARRADTESDDFQTETGVLAGKMTGREKTRQYGGVGSSAALTGKQTGHGDAGLSCARQQSSSKSAHTGRTHLLNGERVADAARVTSESASSRNLVKSANKSIVFDLGLLESDDEFATDAPLAEQPATNASKPSRRPSSRQEATTARAPTALFDLSLEDCEVYLTHDCDVPVAGTSSARTSPRPSRMEGGSRAEIGPDLFRGGHRWDEHGRENKGTRAVGSEVCPSHEHVLVAPPAAAVPPNIVAAPLVILVSTREVSSAPQVISDLRVVHGVATEVRSLPAEDYAVSARAAVLRMSFSDLNSASCRRHLLSRLHRVRRLYRCCYLVVESDRVRPGKVAPPSTCSRAAHQLIARLCRDRVRLLHTSDYAETATTLVHLARSERSAGFGLPPCRDDDHDPAEQARRRLLETLPRFSVPAATLVRQRFSTVAEVLASTPAEFSHRLEGVLSRVVAAELCQAIRWKFQPC